MLSALIVSLVLNLLLIARPWRSRRAINDFGNGIFLPAPDDPRWTYDGRNGFYQIGQIGEGGSFVRVYTEHSLWSASAIVRVGPEWWSGIKAVRYRAAVRHAHTSRKALEAIE